MAAPQRAALLGLLVLDLAGRGAAQPRQQPQKLEPPKWLSDAGKDIFNDVEAEEDRYLGEAACEMRERLLVHMAGQGSSDAAQHRSRVLLALGLCEYKKGDFKQARKRFDSMVSELNLPNEDLLMQEPQLMPVGLMRQAASHMHQYEVTQAATALRRMREIMDRNLRKVLKQIHKQMSAGGQAAPPLDKITAEIPGFGKTGEFLPMIKKQVPAMQQDFSWAELVEQELDKLDGQLARVDKALKAKRLRLATGKSGSAGMLMYVRALSAEPIIPAERLAVAEELDSTGAVRALLREAEGQEKALFLWKNGKEGSACSQEKALARTCELLKEVSDVRTNAFGSARLLIVKAGKQLELEACSTNANVGVLVAVKDGAKLTVAGAEAPVELQAGEPVGFDFCQESSLQAEALTPVLFAQAWHPEFTAVERTTELRARKKAFGLGEEDLKVVTKVVNDYAKRKWDKVAKQWLANSAGLAEMKRSLQAASDERRQAEETEAEAKRREEEGNDEERQKAIAELEKKRAAKREKAEKAEQARLKRKKMLEEERARRDPWLSYPEVVEAEKKIEDLKEERREANAKLEFGLSTQLTKDISTAERALRKAVKKAKKAYYQENPDKAPKKKKAEKAAKAEKADDAEELKANLEQMLQKVKDEVNSAADLAEAAGGDRAAAGAAALKEKLGDLTKMAGDAKLDSDLVVGDKSLMLQGQLMDVKEAKKKALEVEDFKKAKSLSKQEKELKAKIQALANKGQEL